MLDLVLYEAKKCLAARVAGNPPSIDPSFEDLHLQVQEVALQQVQASRAARGLPPFQVREIFPDQTVWNPNPEI